MDNSDSTFSSAKLREFVRGEIKQNDDLHHHTGLVDPDSEAQDMLSFMESIYRSDDDLPHDLQATKAAQTLRRSAASEHVGRSVEDTSAYAVGLTDKSAEIAPAAAFSKMTNSLHNNGAPYTAVVFGGMNLGKTSYALLLTELWTEVAPLKYQTEEDPVILTNAESITAADRVVQSFTEFRDLLFGSDGWAESDGRKGTPPEISPETPVLWFFDECSTHLDARTNNYEVASNYTPLLKRFAKVNTDALHLGHSGFDVHAELRRATIITEFIFKNSLESASVFESMRDDQGHELLYELHDIPDTSLTYDPDDFAPWTWD